MKRREKGVHQKAGAVNEGEEVSHVSDEHLPCSDDEDGEETDDEDFACEGNLMHKSDLRCCSEEVVVVEELDCVTQAWRIKMRRGKVKIQTDTASLSVGPHSR
ncbi:hypothetical protein PoB_003554000 [Plakobranchus ocellatus]|uniref:Uncharacterized protein n=1 Tax=Plakobranchus ocellatus TaxID=259542 RepID=A0AAV4ANU8_9GAST|nr:hypothetical protein PoB_003554000 [Plakobranchus ocellatus]